MDLATFSALDGRRLEIVAGSHCVVRNGSGHYNGVSPAEGSTAGVVIDLCIPNHFSLPSPTKKKDAPSAQTRRVPNWNVVVDSVT